MLRSDVIQSVLNLYNNPNYLEIGVNAGVTFLPLIAANKVAVDPDFRFSITDAAKSDKTAKFYSMVCDDYFLKACGREERFDVVFLDGLHTFEQTLRDLMNSIACIKPGSIIIIDDVLPDGYSASISNYSEFHRFHAASGEKNGNWMGDVYRLVYFISAFMPMYSYATVAENHGQIVMWRDPRPIELDMSVEAVSRVSYCDVVLDMKPFNIKPFKDIMNLIVEWRRL
jgi:hypothetical protein